MLVTSWRDAHGLHRGGRYQQSRSGLPPISRPSLSCTCHCRCHHRRPFDLLILSSLAALGARASQGIRQEAPFQKRTHAADPAVKTKPVQPDDPPRDPANDALRRQAARSRRKANQKERGPYVLAPVKQVCCYDLSICLCLSLSISVCCSVCLSISVKQVCSLSLSVYISQAGRLLSLPVCLSLSLSVYISQAGLLLWPSVSVCLYQSSRSVAVSVCICLYRPSRSVVVSVCICLSISAKQVCLSLPVCLSLSVYISHDQAGLLHVHNHWYASKRSVTRSKGMIVWTLLPVNCERVDTNTLHVPPQCLFNAINFNEQASL